MTIRELVDEKVVLFRDLDSIDPHQLAQEVVELSSLWASVNKELVDKKYWFAVLKKKMLEEHKQAAKANIYAEADPLYKDLLEVESYSKFVLEMIRAGKRYLQISESEKRESMY